MVDQLRYALRARAHRQHVAASAYFAEEVATALGDLKASLGELDVPCDFEVGAREGRMQLADGQSLRLTLHTDAEHCDLWVETQAFASFVPTKLWSRRWRLGQPSAWDRERVVDFIIDWLARLPSLPEELEVRPAAPKEAQ